MEMKLPLLTVETVAGYVRELNLLPPDDIKKKYYFN
jgi:hypothetical protein